MGLLHFAGAEHSPIVGSGSPVGVKESIFPLLKLSLGWTVCYIDIVHIQGLNTINSA